MKTLALLLIKFYQKFISPYKGFSCAHRVATGEVGCSGYGKKVIERYGIVKGYALLKRRFFDCKWHSEQLKEKRKQCNHTNTSKHVYHGGLKYQQGFVDCACDVPSCDCPDISCPDLPSCNIGRIGSNVTGCFELDVCDCADCGPEEKRKDFQEKRNKRNEKKYGVKDSKKAEEDNVKKSGAVNLNKDESVVLDKNDDF